MPVQKNKRSPQKSSQPCAKPVEKKCSLEVVVVEQIHHARQNKFQTISKNIILTVNVHSRKMLFSMKTSSTVNDIIPDMMAPRRLPENTKNNDLYLVHWRDLVKTNQHISQLFGYKFQSKMQHAFQSKHSHSTPGISIYFHTPSCCDVARIH